MPQITHQNPPNGVNNPVKAALPFLGATDNGLGTHGGPDSRDYKTSTFGKV
jgi:hypothetical protein